MNKIFRGALGLLIIAASSLVAIGIIFSNLAKKSLYQDSGEIRAEGLNTRVRVYMDDYGVPHIFAESEHDLYYTLGYMHARDRLWQMDIMRRAAEGRLSQIFGSSTIEYDRLFRMIRINKTAFELYKNISQKSRDILEAYSEGVNVFIQMHRKQLPIEFDVLNYQPDEWKPEHSLMVGRLMAWDLNLNWYGDYAFREIVDKVGIEKALEIFPDRRISSGRSFKDMRKANEGENGFGLKTQTPRGQESPLLESGIKKFVEVYLSYRQFRGMRDISSGSNSWVISGSKSETEKPILANDPHLNLESPSRWYEVHLKGGNIDVMGATLPGVPAVIIGHNRAVSWGLTNLMNDDNDFVILDRDSTNPLRYIYKGQSLFPDSSVEKIEVKDSTGVYLTVKETKLGPVVSDLRTGILKEDKLIALLWTGFENSDELKALYMLNTAKNWEEFKSGLKDFGCPAQNFIYADTAGNIGYQAAGKVPKRSQSQMGRLPPGENAEWTGYVDFDMLPGIFNPKDSFIVTANTDPFEVVSGKENQVSEFYISWTWEPRSRLERIKEMLQKKTKFNVDDFRLIQMDHVSLYAKEMVKYLLASFGEGAEETQEVRDGLNRMRNWDGLMKPENPEGAIFNVFFVNLVKNIYEDELGEKVFYDFLTLSNIPYRSTAVLLEEANSSWFDNVNTAGIERKEEIIRKSFRDAVWFLISRFGTGDMNMWRWGEMHQLKFMHPLGNAAALDKTFNIGPYQLGGDYTTVNNSGFSLVSALKDGRFEPEVGPSMRMISDLSNIEHSLSINSTGQSGQPTHPNYSDQSRLWIYGDYKEGAMDEFEIAQRGYKYLVLSP